MESIQVELPPMLLDRIRQEASNKSLNQVITEAIQMWLEKHKKKSTEDAWDLLEGLAGTVEGPEDWATEHHHYLYGTPKRADQKKP